MLPSYSQENENNTAANNSSVETNFFRPNNQAQKTTDVKLEDAKKDRSFLNWINNRAYAASIDKRDERKILRQKWKKMLGVDIFYPYFKAKEVEDWVKEKTSVRFFKIKGKPEFDENQIKYIFKIKF